MAPACLTTTAPNVPSPAHHFMHTIKAALREHGPKIAYRPYIDGKTWGAVTMAEVEAHIAAACEHWKSAFTPDHFHTGDVIGCWLTGKKYTDIVNVLGLCSAGFVPELFSPNFSAKVIEAMLAASYARTLVIDPELAPLAAELCASNPLVAPLRPSELLTIDDLVNRSKRHGALHLGELPAVLPTDPAFIGHTSGSTAGLPKAIPQAHRWINQIHAKWAVFEQPRYGSQTVLNTFGSLAHVGSFAGFLGAVGAGTCTVQPSGAAITPEELYALYEHAGLNTIMLYSTFLATLLQQARKDEMLLKALRGMRLILYMGVPLDQEDEEWGYSEKSAMNLRNYFATSECANLLASSVGHAPADRLLRITPGSSAHLIPYSASSDALQLFELVLPKDAPDGPTPEMYASDGWYHTGDLFERVEVGENNESNADGWVYRGRFGDWIKTTQGFVDTLSAEDALRRLCADLIQDAVVVGQGRPWPAFIIETQHDFVGGEEREAALKRAIADRMHHWGKDRYKWERVEDTKRILVVSDGELLRTGEKGNVRRNATAEKFKTKLDAMFE